MREQLIAYLLDDLSAEERCQIEARIQQDPHWKRELDQLKSCFEECAVGSSDASHPPQDLALRTCHLVQVSSHPGAEPTDRISPVLPQTPEPDAPVFTSGRDLPGILGRWSMIDYAITGGILATLVMFLLPGLHQSREASRRLTCKNNLQQVGEYLVEYATLNGGELPHVAPHENAGIFTLKLIRNGQVSRQLLGERLVCPSSPMAEKIFSGMVEPCIPTVEQLALAQKLAKAKPQKLVIILRDMSGSYAYRLGYDEKGAYHHIKLTERNDSPMLGDAPAWRANGSYHTFHGGSLPGSGSNVISQNLSVRFILRAKANSFQDDYFLNSNLEQAAGKGPQDVVLGRSEVRPDGLTWFQRP